MITLGASRYPYSRPAAASSEFRPQNPRTMYRSQNFHPWVPVLGPMQTYRANLPAMPSDMGPGRAPQPSPPPQTTPMGDAAMMRGVRGGRLNPTRTMRNGFLPEVNGNASNVRSPVVNALQMIRALGPR